jgi:hypothetical protein
MLDSENEDWQTLPNISLHELRSLVPPGRVLFIDFTNDRMRLRPQREDEPDHEITRLFSNALQG